MSHKVGDTVYGIEQNGVRRESDPPMIIRAILGGGRYIIASQILDIEVEAGEGEFESESEWRRWLYG